MMRASCVSLLPPPRAFSLRGKNILVLGMGDSGLSVANWVKRAGGRVRAADTRQAPPRKKDYGGELHTGKFRPALLKGVDLVCISPGISLKEEIVQAAIAKEIPVVGDIELFAWAVRGRTGRTTPARVVAVTGTNGKSTVAALTGHLLRSAGIDCEVAGNISPPALDALTKRTAPPAHFPDVWVLELSSYQLETTWSLAPEAAAMLNLSEDHLDRYAGLAHYAAAKARIFLGEGAQILNRADSASMALALAGRRQVTFGPDAPEMPEDFGMADGWLCRGKEQFFHEEGLPLSGSHNTSNALAACALAREAGAPLATLGDGLRSFRGLPHRMQRVALRAGVAWFDDSKGTNVGATVAALQGLAPTAGLAESGASAARVVLILGGEGKGQDFSPLASVVKLRARHVLLIGKDAALIRRALADTRIPLEKAENLEAAVTRAAAIAQSGDAVLLSPACASFDMFRDYRHRGEAFAAAVKRLA